MRQLLWRLTATLGVAWFVTLLVLGFLAYFVTKPCDAGMCDGLGRPLSIAPFLVRLMLGQDRLWTGWIWFIGDIVAVMGSAMIAANIVEWHRRSTRAPR